ncbi:type I restriction modification system subunit S [Bacillus safensis]|nr:type I restriction modification system subunit S [Bacillus safensis]
MKRVGCHKVSKKKKTIEELLEEALVQEEKQPYEVPKNWKWVKMGSVITLISGRDLSTKLCNSKEKGIPYIMGASNIVDNQLDVERWIETPTVIGVRGDILVSVKGTVGKVIIQELDEVHLSRQIMALRSKDTVLNKFLYLYIQTYVEKLKEAAKGIIPGISRDDILNAPFPLLPLNEQKRIADKVERLLSKIEEAKQLIEEAKETFELRRASILEKAFSGELLTSSFNKITKKINEQITLEIPNHWEVKTLSKVVQSYNNQRIPVSKKKREEMQGDIPYYGATGIVDFVDGYTHEGEFVCIGEDGANLLSRSKPQAFIIRGKSWVNNHAHVVKMNDNMCNNYLMHYINFIPLNDYVTGTAQPKLNRKNLDKIPIVLPPVNEQFAISQKIEGLLSKEIELMKVCDSNLHGIDIIKKSIMNKAFRGELGTNDPSEENMIELLKEVLQEQVK